MITKMNSCNMAALHHCCILLATNPAKNKFIFVNNNKAVIFVNNNHMARPKNIKPTKLASGRIIASRHEYLVAKYGSIAAALNHLWASDTMPAVTAQPAAPSEQAQAAAIQPKATEAPAATIDQLLAELLAETPGVQPPLY